MSRFPVLRTIAYLLKGFAVLAVLLGLLVALTQDGGAMKLAYLAGALLYGVMLWAFSELISVALSIESNTYQTQQVLTAGASPANKPLQPLTLPPVPSKSDANWTPAAHVSNVPNPVKTQSFDRLP